MTNKLFLIKNANGSQVSLLNKETVKKRYYCSVSGCHKSFTTSGHLARHCRIHTGEKNFHCLYPGCLSKFSRQDNMMQHFRTHSSSRSKIQYYYHYNQYQKLQKSHYFTSEVDPHYTFYELKSKNIHSLKDSEHNIIDCSSVSSLNTDSTTTNTSITECTTNQSIFNSTLKTIHNNKYQPNDIIDPEPPHGN